jgi:predicted nucleotidyltransferase
MFFYEEIFRAFQEQKVKYVLVGGVAVNLLGSMRSTADLDILVEMSDENLKTIITILQEGGYLVKQPVDPLGLADTPTRENWIKHKHMKAFNFYKKDDIKEVDIIIAAPVSFEEAIKDAVLITVDDVSIPIASIDKLIKMKKGTGRPVDKFDIIELKKLKKLKENHDL